MANDSLKKHSLQRFRSPSRQLSAFVHVSAILHPTGKYVVVLSRHNANSREGTDVLPYPSVSVSPASVPAISCAYPDPAASKPAQRHRPNQAWPCDISLIDNPNDMYAAGSMPGHHVMIFSQCYDRFHCRLTVCQ